MRDQFETAILAQVRAAVVNGQRAPRLPNTSSIAFEEIDSQAALILLDRNQVCCSAGSACKTGSAEGSHVLRAMHLGDERAKASLRFSFGRFNAEDDVQNASRIVSKAMEKLRQLSSSVGVRQAAIRDF
jgi:cysteine desulfurase